MFVNILIVSMLWLVYETSEDYTIPARMICLAIWETAERFGIGLPLMILKRSEGVKVREKGMS